METKQLLYIVEVQGEDKSTACELARAFRKKRIKKSADNLLDGTLYTQTVKVSDSVYRFYTYDFYIIKNIGILQRLHHYIRKGYTAALRYVGINPPVIIIKHDPGLPAMDGARQ